MINIKRFIILNILFSSINCFILPQIFREWHPIGIESKIDKTKPYVYNIGKLPLVLWYDNNNNTLSTVNICKHFGARLDNGIINNGCLHCSNHFTLYNSSDTIGNVVSKNGLLWWSYKSFLKSPTQQFKKDMKLYNTYIDIDVNIVNVILEFIYNTNNKKQMTRNINNKFFFKEILYNAEHRFVFKYPYYIKGNINKNIDYTFNFLPLDDNKTRIFISIINNIDSKIYMNYYLNTKILNLKNYDNNSYLKYMIMMKDSKDNNMKNIYSLFDKYLVPNEFTVSCFYKYRQFY
jgi:hypothetical protein